MTFSSLLKNPKLKAAFIVIAAGLILYLAVGSWMSKIQYTDKSIHNYWGVLKLDCDRRAQMLPKYAQLIQAYAVQSQDVVQALTKAFEAYANAQLSEEVLTDAKANDAFVKLQSEIVNALIKVQKQAQHAPLLAQNRQFLMLNMDLQNIENQIQTEAYFINRDMVNYNGYLTGYPARWVNALFLGAKLKIALQIPTVKSS